MSLQIPVADQPLNPSNPLIHSFTYDNVGNRLTADGVAYIANNLNQYSSVGGVNFGYDLNGNLTSDGTNTYTYDEENRLSTVNAPQISYTFDAFNRRVSKTVNPAGGGAGVTTYFIYDGAEDIVEYNGAGVLQAEYVYGGNIDEVLTMERGGQTYYYFQDGLGSVSDITNSSGTVLERYSYDVYGTPTILDTNYQPLATSAIGNPFYFTGRRLDPESGLYFYRNRMLHPGIGRFMQRDPIGYYDSMNLFQYVGNSPVNYIDPYGLLTWNWEQAKRQALAGAIQGGLMGAILVGTGSLETLLLPGILIGGFFGSASGLIIGGLSGNSTQSDIAICTIGGGLGGAIGGTSGAIEGAIGSNLGMYLENRIRNNFGEDMAIIFGAPTGLIAGGVAGGLIGYFEGGLIGAGKGLIIGGSMGFVGGGIGSGAVTYQP